MFYKGRSLITEHQQVVLFSAKFNVFPSVEVWMSPVADSKHMHGICPAVAAGVGGGWQCEGRHGLR